MFFVQSNTVLLKYREGIVVTTLRDVSASNSPDIQENTSVGSNKHSKKKLRKLMKRMTDPHKVLNLRASLKKVLKYYRA